jgi:hypothetical protein
VDGQVIVPAHVVWQEYYAQNAMRTMIHGTPEGPVNTPLLADVISQCLSRALLDREAARLGYTLTPAEEAALRPEEVARWGSEEKYRTALMLLSVSEEHQLAKARSTVMRRKLAEGAGGTARPLTAEEARRYYDEHLDQFHSKAKPPLRYVFAPHAPGVDLKSLYWSILTEADTLRRQRKTFAELAARHSKHASGPGGGLVDEGASPRLPFQPTALKACRSSQFVLDDAGMHLYLRDCVLLVPFEEAGDRIRELSRKERDDRFLSDLLGQLKAKARIDYLPLEGAVPPPPPRPGHHEGEKTL